MIVYLAESNMWKRLSLLEQPGLGLSLISMNDQDWKIPENTTQCIVVKTAKGILKNHSNLRLENLLT